MNRKAVLKFLLKIIPLALLLAACAQSPQPPAPPQVVVRPQTRVLDPTTRSALKEVRADGTLVFSPTPEAKALKKGDVIVSEPTASAPYGLLRRVTADPDKSGDVVIKTTQAQIGDALQKAKLSAQWALTPADVQSVTYHTQGVRLLSGPTPQDDKLRVGIDVLISDTDGNPDTKGDNIVASGEVTFKPVVTVDLDLDCGGFICTDLDIDFLGKIGVTETADLKVAGKGIYGANIKKTIPLATFNFGPHVIYVGVPIVITPKIVMELRFDGTIGVTISYEASQTLTAVAGAKYDDGWENISELNNTFNAGPVGVPSPFTPTLDVTGKAALRAELMFYGVVGPYIEIVPKVRFNLEYPRDPLWKLYAGIEGNVGVDIDVLGISKNYSTNLWDDSVEIAHAGNTAPQIQFISPTNNQDVDVNVCCTIHAEVKDAEDGASCCAVSFTSSNTADGAAGELGEGSGSGGERELGYTFTTLGSRTITATATDSKGKTGSASVTIKVVNTPPTVAISAPYGGQQFFRGVAYTLRGISYDLNETGDQLPCSSLTWSSGVAGDGLPQSGCSLTWSFPSNGVRTLTLTGTDSFDASTSATVSVNVVDPPANLPPVVNLTQPQNGISIGPDTVIQLAGSAADPEGGAVAPVWDVTTGYNPQTGTGANTYTVTPAAGGDWKPSDTIPYDNPGSCNEVDDTLRLRLRATDPQGNEGFDFIVIKVIRIC